MSWLDEFRTGTPKSETDNTDRTNEMRSRLTADTSFLAKTRIPRTDNTGNLKRAADGLATWTDRALSLEASRDRLMAARISIAIFDNGSMRIIRTGTQSGSDQDGSTEYSAEDLWHYVQLEPHERRLLHSFKKRFGGSTEWKEQ